MLYSRSLLALCLTYSIAGILIPISQYIPLYLSPLVNLNLFSEICESVSVLWISLCTSSFLYSMCKWYPMSDLTLLSLIISRSIPVAVSGSISFFAKDWGIFHYICGFTASYLSCRCMFRLLPRLGCCQQCCYEHWGACVFSSPSFHTLY